LSLIEVSESIQPENRDDIDAGMIGGIIGGAIGLAGGAIGTYASIKSTCGPREKRFMVRIAIVAWLGITLFLALLFVLPNPYRWLIWIPYGVALPLAILSLNRKQQAIRAGKTSLGERN
jgi:phosphotransferase system  glucose/maltose/N-acetylglucosamine-specific IIC component